MIQYQTYCDDYILDDMRTDDYVIVSPKLTLEKNKVGGFTFTIYKKHPYFDKVKIKRSIIEVRKNSKTIFRGRVSEYTQAFNLSMKVDVECVLSFLNDSLYSPFEFQGKPADLLKSVIENHNAQVQEWQQFKIGTIDTTIDKNGYINRSSIEYLTSWEVIESRLLNIGGLFRVRYEDDGNYLDWIEGTHEQLYTATQVVEFGENIVDIQKKNNGTETYTAILPLGAEIEAGDTETEATKQRLTIEALEDDDTSDIVKSGKWLYSKSAVENYGWIVAPLANTTWNDVTINSNLLTKATEYLTETAIRITDTIEINAIDLSLTDEEIGSIDFLDYIRVKSNIHGLDDTFLLTKYELPYKDPQNAKFTVGETKLTLTAEQLGNKYDKDNFREELEAVKKDYATNEKVDAIVKIEQENYTNIKKDAEKIVLEALGNYVETSEYEQYKKSQKAALELTDGKISMNFNTTTEQINNVDGDWKSKYDELRSYIDFEGGTITLGKEGNIITLTLEDDVINFKKNGVVYGSWDGENFYTGNIIIRLGERFQVGNFAYLPRTDGSVMLVKVGG